MADLIVTSADFVAYYGLATDIQLAPRIQAYIDRWEKYYIRRLLGVELGNLFIADLANATQDPRFVVIEDAFDEQDETWCNKIRSSRGMKDMLTAMIYYHFVFDGQLSNTQTGVNLPQNETSQTLSPRAAAREAEKKWNELLDTVEAIQWYCRDFKPEDYPEYLGLLFEPRYVDFL